MGWLVCSWQSVASCGNSKVSPFKWSFGRRLCEKWAQQKFHQRDRLQLFLSEQCRKENRSEKWVSTSCEIDAEVVVSKRWRLYTLLNVWVESHFLLSLHKELFWCGATGGKFFSPWRILWDGSGYALRHVFGCIFMGGQLRLPYWVIFCGAWKAVRNEKNKYFQKPSFLGSISIPGVYELLYLFIWMNLVGIHFAIILFCHLSNTTNAIFSWVPMESLSIEEEIHQHVHPRMHLGCFLVLGRGVTSKHITWHVMCCSLLRKIKRRKHVALGTGII